ncbi:glycoside hydrolase family 26 protein [Maribellus sediminis]|uniref:glycoside hydrolase family 26 protein n=1 Tax=Maribellus sediminis TaxID=2696285 RepID=UPI00142FDF27|nr:glycosyl hydrolase [Maribellus sediminis]
MKLLSILSLLFLANITWAQKSMPTDSKATTETINLYRNLMQLQHEKLMFGHQDDLAYGHTWVFEEGRSDVKEVCGDYPAVYGWELGHIELGDAYSLDSVYFDKIQKWIKKVYDRGGVNTISWHLRNPYTGGTAWDTSSKQAVKSILPGGEKHELFCTYLDRLATFLEGLKTEDGTYIPVLFRPYHEHTGSWFWWGKNLCTPVEYKALWRFTVGYLQNEKNIHHLLYSYSTDRVKTVDEYLERYPGDDIVDILAFDLYDRGPDYPEALRTCATIVTDLAKNRNKVATMSETGASLSENPEWWTKTLLEAVKPFDLSYVLVWRNPWKRADHGAFGPYKNSPDATDFVKFYNDPKTVFQKEVSKLNLYKSK